MIKKCDHIQFPNSHLYSLQKCDTPLSDQKELEDGKIINSPLLIYPMGNIKDQFLHMYQRLNFKKVLDYGPIEIEVSKKIFFVIYMMAKFGIIFQIVE